MPDASAPEPSPQESVATRQYVYKATADGTLSNPFTFVKEGQTVVLREPVEASWLTPLNEYQEPKELPPTATFEHQTRNIKPEMVSHADAPGHKDYDRGIEEIKKAEAAQDAKEQEHDKAIIAPPAAAPNHPAEIAQGAPAAPPPQPTAPTTEPQPTVDGKPAGVEGVDQGTGSQDVLG